MFTNPFRNLLAIVSTAALLADAGLSQAVADENPQSPDLEVSGSLEEPDAVESQAETPELPTESAYQRPNHQRRDLPEEGQQFIRSIALILLPQKFDDENAWGDEKRIQSGLNVDIDGGKLKTSRRWKMVNHGTWLKGSGELVDPVNTFTLRAIQLPDPDEETQRYEIHASAKLQVNGRQQQWNYGVMLWSISADALVDVSLFAVLDVKTEVVTTSKGARLRFVPTVTQAAVRLDNFRLQRISHLKGTVVQAHGEVIEELIQMRLHRENKDLPARINKAINKKSDRLEIPFDIGGWFGVSPKSDPAQSDPAQSDPAQPAQDVPSAN